MSPRSSAAIRVAIVEDVPLFRDVLAQAIASDPGLELVRTAASAHEALTVIAPAAPDVLLLDLNLPDGFGFEVGLELRRALPHLRVIILSEHVRPQVLGALPPDERPYWSYLLKTGISSRDELVGAIRTSTQHTLVDTRVRESASMEDVRLELLSDRQREILALVASGMSNSAIAERLHMSTKSVEYHLTQVYAQLNLLGDASSNNRVQAAVRYLAAEQQR